MRSIIQTAAVLAVLAAACGAGEIGYVEDFALASDRAEALKQLIPGTDDYYYYHCLHYQNLGQPDKVAEMLKLWIDRRGNSVAEAERRVPRIKEIRNREALLGYGRDAKASLDFLKWRLGLTFSHQKDVLDRKPDLPTALDPKLISRATLTRRAFARGGVGELEDVALDWLAGTKLDANHRRALLQRLTRPDIPGLARMVVDDLNYRHSGGFGSMKIHARLTRAQLDECLKLKADLLNETNFVNAYLTKLHTGADVDLDSDLKAREAYLDRLWAFVSRLAPAHNSLKVHVLYQRLVFDRARGVYNKDRFMTYIKLPRNVPYIEPRYLQIEAHRRWRANLGADFRSVTLLPSVSRDEPLVRSYLLHFFEKEDSWKPYQAYIRDTYLKPLFAEAKILSGQGDPEQWASDLAPAAFRALKDRVDIDFAWTNKEVFGPTEKVSLAVDVKNVRRLTVKVFEINTLNYYREQSRSIDSGINLDGLVTNAENDHAYTQPPLRRHREVFDFPELTRRGVYVVEFIGNGMSSRALIRKGQLRHVARTSTAGAVLTILDEAGNKVPDARVWMAGQLYRPDEDGTVTVPYSTQPGRTPIVLIRGDFASLDWLDHPAESYRLAAGLYVDRETLQTRRTVPLLVRPVLYLNNEPVTLSVLEQVTLEIATQDLDGVGTVKTIEDFKLHEDRESVYEFQVPERLQTLRFTLRAKVHSYTRSKKIDLADSATFSLNGIDRTEKVEDLHLLRIAADYAVDVLGRSGETNADRPVAFHIKHRDFKPPVDVSLQSDANGRVALGKLTDIEWVAATGPEGTRHQWVLPGARHSLPGQVHGRVGQAVHVPYMGSLKQPDRMELGLLELGGGSYVRDCFESLKIKDGFVVIDDLPAGDYRLFLKRVGAEITLRLTDGEQRLGYVMGDRRRLEVRNAAPLQITALSADRDAVTIRLANAGEFARVHVVATRFMPAYSIYGHLGGVGFPEPAVGWLQKPQSKYQAGRDIGDEYRYILDRKHATKYPGNMLTRPGLLLNPWAVRKTEAGKQEAAGGQAWGAEAAERPSGPERGGIGGQAEGRPADTFADLNFLPAPAAVLRNLRPDADGVVRIARKDLGYGQQIHVLAADPANTVYRELSLAEQPIDYEDLRLIRALPTDQHFTQKKQITVVRKGEALVLDDLATSELEVYDTLAKVYALYATLSGDRTLAEFAFVLRWPTLADDEKRTLYSKYACHELNFFIQQKDPAFFETVVQPYLRNKKDKTFLDHWLGGDDLRGYLRPWSHRQINIVETILLGRRIEGERPVTARFVKDRYDLLPPDIERFNHLFDTALKAGALETTDALGLDKARQILKLQRELEEGALADTPAPRRARGRPAAAKPGEPVAPSAAPELAKSGGKRARRSEAAARDIKERLQDRADRDEEADGGVGGGRKGRAYFAKDAKKLAEVRRLYVKLDKTQEWAENNYYHLPIERQNAELITVNALWNDYAAAGDGPFLSAQLAEASRTFPEMMLALAVLDLPFEPAKHDTAIDGATFTLTARADLVAFHKEIKPVAAADGKLPILVSQNFYRHGDRYIQVGNERRDKFVTEEFLVRTVYGCHVVITNPTSSRQKLDVLIQVPRGAIPVLNSHYTRSVHVVLDPYRTHTMDYFFYFPAAGTYPHFPVHVARNEQVAASAQPFTLNVVDKLTKIDTASWDYISQFGTPQEVIDFLKTHNLNRIKLSRIAWRMRDRDYFRRVIGLLAERHAYDQTLWSYGIRHDVPPAIRQYLQHADAFVARCGDYLDSPLLTIDPILRKAYQHLEYSPLVNARAHQLGRRRRIVNERFSQQYHRLMKILTYRRGLDTEDLLSVCYYLLLQDRIEEALDFFGRLDHDRVTIAQLQHDYMRAYVDFYTPGLDTARAMAARYKDHPVDRWRNAFASVAVQLDEIAGRAAQVVDEQDRTQQQTALAAGEPSFDFTVEARAVTLNYQNLKEVTVNYYLMDVELMFSRQPFVRQFSGQFAYIRPNQTATVKLPADRASHRFELPEELGNSNVMVEIVGGPMRRAQAYYANSLAVQVIANYGQVRVSHAEGGKPLAKVYVKVYARLKDGRVAFYKDGYTDLRGRFDYSSLNTNELDFVKAFSLLILSDAGDGAVVREAAPPKR